MTTQMTSQEALNSIFGILTSMMDTKESKLNQQSSETNDTITSLLKGIIETNSAENVKSTGEALEALAKGVAAFEDTAKDLIKDISKGLISLNNALLIISDNSQISSGVDNLLEVLKLLGNIDPEIANNFSKFINNLGIDTITISKNQVAAVNTTLSLINTVIDINVKKLIKNLKYLGENVDVAKNIGEFIIKLNESLTDPKIKIVSKETAKSVGELLGGIAKFADVSIWKLIKAFNPITAWIIGKALSTFLKNVNDAINDAAPAEKMKGINELLKPIAELGTKNFNIKNIRNALSLETALRIGMFFKILVKTLPKDEYFNAATKNITELITALSKIEKKNAKAIKALGKVLNKDRAVSIVEFLQTLCSIDVTEKQVENTKNIINAFTLISFSMLTIFGTLAILITILPITSLLLAAGMMYIGTKFMINTVNILVESIKDKEVKHAKETATALAILMGTLTLSLVVLTLVSKSASIKDIGLGIILFATVVGAGLLIVNLLKPKEQNNNNIDKAINAMYAISVLFLSISASISILTLAIAKNKPEDVWIGVGVLTVIVAISVGTVALLSIIDDKKLKNSTIALLGISAVFTIISLVAITLLIPIGKKAGKVLLGSGVILLTILGMVGIVALLNKIDASDLSYGLIATAGVVLILMATSLIVKHLIIPIADYWKDALIGFGIVYGMILAMGGIVWLLSSKLFDLRKMLYAAGTLVLITVSMLILGVASGIIIDVALKAGERAGDTFAGLGAIGTILVGVVGITLLLGKIKEDTLIKGAIATAGLSALIYLLGKCLTPIIDLAIKAGTNEKDTFEGLGAIGTILGSVGLIIVGLGALLTNPIMIFVMGAGAIAVAGLSLCILLISSSIGTLLPVLDEIRAHTSIKDDMKMLASLMPLIYDIIWEATPNIKLSATIGFAVAALYDMVKVAFAIKVLANNISSIIKQISIDDITTFKSIAIGNGNEVSSDSLLGTMKTIVKSFSGFDGAGSAMLIAWAIRPVLNTLSQFIDIVKKVATLSYISGYDRNGKPIFDKLDPSVFGDAATVVSGGFKTFITDLNEGFREIGVWGMLLVKMMGNSLNPIVKTVGKFVDIVIKVAKMQIITGYDRNGKPKYETVDPSVFGDAATAVSGGFKTFLTDLNTGLKELLPIGSYTIKQMGKALKPVVDTVGKFVDIVMKVAKMQIITGYDNNGNPKFELLTSADFIMAAVSVSITFKLFLEKLSESMKSLDELTIDAMNSVKKSIAPVMQGVSNFVDAIVKLSTAMIPDEWNDDGTPKHFTLITNDYYTNAAETIATSFGTFLDAVTTNFTDGFFTSKTENALEAIGDNIGAVMEGITKWNDAIIKLAAGIVEYETTDVKTGLLMKMHKEITPEDYITAAGTIIGCFSVFVEYITKKFSDPEFKKKAESIKGIIKDSVNPILDAVVKFSESLKPFLTMQNDKAVGEGKYLVANKDFVTNIATNIATGFTEFIRIISDELSKEANQLNYTLLAQTMPIIKKALDNIEDSSKSLASVINALTKDNKIITTGKAVAEQFLKSLKAFTNINDKDENGNIINDNSIYQNALTTYKTYINPLLTHVKKSAELISEIINLLNPDGNTSYTNDISNFNNIIEMLATKTVSINERIKGIDFLHIKSMGDTYHHIALKFGLISDYMLNNADLTSGIDIFVTNLNKLTSTEINANIVASGGNIKLYVTTLETFNNTIKTTTSSVKIYVTELDTARTALQALDKQIIDNENARNNALQSFADKVNNIAEAVTKLKESFESLNENKILSQFNNVRNLLNTINTDIETTESNNSNINLTVNKSGNYGINNTAGNNKSGNTTTTVQTPLMGNNIKIEFIIDGKAIPGFMNIKPKM